MPQFKNKEEYEKWKAEQAISSQGKPLENREEKTTIDENVIWQGKPDWLGYFFPLVFLAIIAFVGILVFFTDGVPFVFMVACALIIIVILRRVQYDFRISDKRIIARKGIVGHRTGELDIADVRSINVTQGILQRLFGIGNIEFTTASGPIKEVTLVNIKNPERLKEMIRKYK